MDGGSSATHQSTFGHTVQFAVLIAPYAGGKRDPAAAKSFSGQLKELETELATACARRETLEAQRG
jgi:hypothetical protein